MSSRTHPLRLIALKNQSNRESGWLARCLREVNNVSEDERNKRIRLAEAPTEDAARLGVAAAHGGEHAAHGDERGGSENTRMAVEGAASDNLKCAPLDQGGGSQNVRVVLDRANRWRWTQMVCF